MIISRGRRYIFVHIPKTGGTALSLALEARAMKDDILIGDTPKALRRRGKVKTLQAAGRLWKHAGLADIDGLVSADEIDAFFCFTMVRNPWDRMVSYYHWLRTQRFAHPAVALAKSLDFSGFVNAPLTHASFSAWPSSAYMRTADGRERCDLFLRLEHFEEDAAALEAHLGFPLGPLQRVNSAPRAADYRGYYSDADAALLGEICAEDVARFGYGF